MIKLHLGCGKRDFGSDWIHIDGSHAYPHIQYHDIINLPMDHNTVDLIYASHVLEYFDREEVVSILKEWYRVLTPSGGILRLAVPDFREMADLYINRGYSLDTFIGPMYGKWMMGDKYIYHKTIYDRISLSKILNDVGFKLVRYWDWKDVEHGKFDDHSQAYIPHMDKENGHLISLNIEGIK